MYQAFISNHQILHGAFNSVVCLLFIILASFTSYWFIRKKTDSKRRLKQYKHRVVYLAIFIYLIFLGRIWISGFTHLVTMLSLVAAGLVVVNKESVMNMVGSLIINWRNLFSEGDCIKIGEQMGYVRHLGLLYIAIDEIDKDFNSLMTGRMIKIPNSLVITTSITNYSQNSKLTKIKLSFIFTPESNIDKAETIMKDIAKNIVNDNYQITDENDNFIIRKNKGLAKLVDANPNTALSFRNEPPVGVEVVLFCYCFMKDQIAIRNAMIKGIVDMITQADDITYISK